MVFYKCFLTCLAKIFTSFNLLIILDFPYSIQLQFPEIWFLVLEISLALVLDHSFLFFYFFWCTVEGLPHHLTRFEVFLSSLFPRHISFHLCQFSICWKIQIGYYHIAVYMWLLAVPSNSCLTCFPILCICP